MCNVGKDPKILHVSKLSFKGSTLKGCLGLLAMLNF